MCPREQMTPRAALITGACETNDMCCQYKMKWWRGWGVRREFLQASHGETSPSLTWVQSGSRRLN